MGSWLEIRVRVASAALRSIRLSAAPRASLASRGRRSVTEANVHRADERIRIDDVVKAAQVVALALADLLGAG